MLRRCHERLIFQEGSNGGIKPADDECSRLQEHQVAAIVRTRGISIVVFVAAALAFFNSGPVVVGQVQKEISLKAVGVYRTGWFDQGGSEIAAYDPASR